MKKRGKIRISFLLCAVMLCFFGCDGVGTEPLSFRMENFDIRAEGSMGGVDFSCDICCENGDWCEMTFLSPEVLAGVTLTRNGQGEIRVEKEGIFADFSEKSSCFRLARIGDVLMKENLTVETVQVLKNGKQLTLKSGEDGMLYTLTLGEDGFPVFLSGMDFSCNFRRLEEGDAF